MDLDTATRWLLEYQSVDPLLRRIRSTMQDTLTELGFPKKAEAAIGLMDAGSWPKRLSPNGRQRARRAAQALIYLQQIRHHLGPEQQCAPAATYAALVAGACAADAVLGDVDLKKARRRGGAVTGKQTRAKAQKTDDVVEKHLKRFRASDELQDRYPKGATPYIRDKTGLPTRTIQNSLKRIERASS